MISEILNQLDRIEAFLIEKKEMDSLGHRIIYNVDTGDSVNIDGARCDPKKLDSKGFQVKI